jgi:F-type H+-transporting ATPase subunit b
MAAGNQITEIARTFGVDWPHLIAQTVSFSIVCALLYRFAYTPVLKALEARRQQIALGQANAEKINAQLAAIEKQREETLAGARTESTLIVAEARDTARRLTEQETARAKLQGEQILQRAREAAEQERRRMMADLRHEAAHLVVETTAAVTGKVLSDADQRRLASEAAARLAA